MKMHLRLGYINMMPYTYGLNGKATGMTTILVDALSKNLNFRRPEKVLSLLLKSRKKVQKCPSVCDQNQNYFHSKFSRDVPIAMLVRKVALLQIEDIDLALGPLVLEEKRHQAFNFLEFHSVTTANILASVGQAGAGSFLNFLFTFESMIWICLLSSFIALVVLSAIDDFQFGKEGKFSRKLSSYFWMYLASMFLEGSFRTPRKGLGKMLLSIWLLSILVLMNGFCSQFKALLMMRSEGEMIHTVEDLARKPHFVLVIPKTTVYEKKFRESDFEAYQKIYQNTVKHNAILDPFEFTRVELYQRVKRGELVITTVVNVMQKHVLEFCDQLMGNRRMYFVKDPVDMNYISFAVTKKFPRTLGKMLNKRIVWLREGGLIDKWLEILSRGFERCGQSSEPPPDDSALSLNQLFPILLIFLAAQGVSFICFLGEVFGRGIMARIRARGAVTAR